MFNKKINIVSCQFLGKAFYTDWYMSLANILNILNKYVSLFPGINIEGQLKNVLKVPTKTEEATRKK